MTGVTVVRRYIPDRGRQTRALLALLERIGPERQNAAAPTSYQAEGYDGAEQSSDLVTADAPTAYRNVA